MHRSRPASRVTALGIPVLTTGLIAAGCAVVIARRRSVDGQNAGRERLRAYLADHLTGSDAAFAVVRRLTESPLPREEAELFERLTREFVEEREIVRVLLHSLGGSPLTLKRLIGHAAGSALRTAVGSRPGKLALFRALESLSVGVQGKRCLWRVARSLEPSLPPPANTTFLALEQQAIDQWQHIEERRLALAARTFAPRFRTTPKISPGVAGS